MPLADDPALLRRVVGFARRVNAGALEAEAARERLPGLLKFARTFYGELLEKEFGTPLTGFPTPARTRAAEVVTQLRHRGDDTAAAQRLMMNLIDLCDLEIDRVEMSPHGEEEDEREMADEILATISRLLERFDDWVDRERLPLLAEEARSAKAEFAEMSGKLRSA